VLRVKAATRSFYEAAVVRALKRIVASLDDALDLSALAREVALSPFHFHRIFRGMLGETPLEMHRRLRLERAADQLCLSERAVTAIAFDAGYETHEAFTRAFRGHYGVPPSEFRERAFQAAAACHGGPATELATRSGLHFRKGHVVLAALNLPSGATTMEVIIETLPARRLATVRHIGPYPEIAEAFHRLGALAAAHGLYDHVDPRMLALYHDDPETTDAAYLRSDAALVIRGEVALPEGLAEASLPAGEYARFTHRGSYAGLGDAWARLMGEWLPSSGFRVGDGPPYECYVNDPRTTKTDELLTDLHVPVTRASAPR
jgi:AraC family transcriptional regulator